MTDRVERDGVPDDLVAHLVGRVADLERCQLAEDVTGFMALFDPAATWVTGGGTRLIGRRAIQAFTESVLPGAFENGSVTYRVELVRMLSPDVALTGVVQTYADDLGAVTGVGLPTYVWVRRGPEWYIAAGQNTTSS